MKKTKLQKTEEINLQFKLLSAIGILMIVGGHCYQGGFSLAYDWFPPYSFHLALFVFISGYFYKPDHERKMARYLGNRAKRLLLPAYLWNIVYGLLVLLLNRFGYTIGGKVDAYSLFVMPFVDGEAFRYNLGSWFVYPLFMVCVINVLFRKLLGLIKADNEWLITAIYLAEGMLAIGLAIQLKESGGVTGWVKLMLRTMFFLPCFQFGRLYYSKLEKYDKLNSVAYFAVLLAIQLTIITFVEKLDYTPSTMSNFHNGFMLPYVTALTGIAFWLRVTRILAKSVGSWKCVRLLADNTYSIMVHHLMGFMAVKWMFYALSANTGLFQDFDAHRLHTSIWYYYLPNGKIQWAIVYLVAGILVPLLIQFICNFCKKKLCVFLKKHK